MSDLFCVHLMDTDYVAKCITVFHGNGAAIDRIRTDFMSGCRPSTYYRRCCNLAFTFVSFYVLFRFVCLFSVFVLLLLLFYIAWLWCLFAE